jgi:hypothetical protein
LKHEREALAASQLRDEELLKAANEALRDVPHEQALVLVSRISATFGRIASLLAARQSGRLLADLKERSLEARRGLVARKELLPSGAVTDALGITRQALNKALRANRIFAVEVNGENYYPAFYADARLDRRKVEKVARTLGDLGGWSKWQFFSSPKGSLGGLAPLDALRKGKLSEVLRAASGFAER